MCGPLVFVLATNHDHIKEKFIPLLSAQLSIVIRRSSSTWGTSLFDLHFLPEDNQKETVINSKASCGIFSAAVVLGFSPRRPWFEPRTVHLEFVVDKVALGQVFV